MQVRQLMQRTVTTIGEDDTLALASQLMKWNGIRHLPVMRGGRVVGMLSERDVLAHAWPDRPLKQEALVREAMSTPVTIAPPHLDTAEAAAMLVGLRIDALPVVEEGELIGIVKREYEEIVKNEVQRAISADEEAIAKLAANYIDNIKAYTLREKVKNKYTGQDEEPDERLMRSIEEKIEIPENRRDDFRREIMNFIGAKAVEGKKFDWQTNDRLRRALELKLFEDQKDSIKLKTLVSAVVDKETQEKIDIIKTRLIRYFGYNEVSATDVLNYVASIYARGDATG